MRLTISSDEALDVIEILRLAGESRSACADRLLANLLQISYDQDNYEQHFGPQVRRKDRDDAPTT